MTLTQLPESPSVPTTASRPSAVVVVGVDGSAAADQALLFAVTEAQQRRATLRIVASHDPAALTAGYAGAWSILPFEDGLQSACESMVQAAAVTVAAVTADRPLTVETVVLSGRASQVLLSEARNAELLVIGSRGAGALDRMLTGSTCTEVVHHAHVPVAVVPSAPAVGI